jgi:hypothetical protein
MAAYTVAAGKHGAYAKTLVASTVDTVTFTDHDLDKVEITSNGAAAVYVTVDGSTPAVADAGTFELPAVAAVREIAVPTAGATVVKLISAGTPLYSVAEPST